VCHDASLPFLLLKKEQAVKWIEPRPMVLKDSMDISRQACLSSEYSYGEINPKLSL